MRKGLEDFNAILLESIYEAMGKALGRGKARVILNHIKRIGDMGDLDILERIWDFDLILKALLGEEGGNTIEEMIIKELYSKIEISPEIHLKWRFPEYIEQAKTKYTEKEKIDID